MSVDVMHLVKQYERATERSSVVKEKVDPLVQIIGAYYMQSDDTMIQLSNGEYVSIRMLLNVNKKSLTLKYLDTILSGVWITRKYKDVPSPIIQCGIVYCKLDEDSMSDEELRKQVCKYIKKMKSALHLKDLCGNLGAILTLPAYNEELYNTILDDVHKLGYSLNELLEFTGAGFILPDVASVYKATGTIVITVGDNLFQYDAIAGEFKKQILYTEGVCAF